MLDSFFTLMEIQLLMQLEYSAGSFDSAADYVLNSFIILMEVLIAVGRCHGKIFYFSFHTVFKNTFEGFLDVAAHPNDTAKVNKPKALFSGTLKCQTSMDLASLFWTLSNCKATFRLKDFVVLMAHLGWPVNGSLTFSTLCLLGGRKDGGASTEST